MKISRSIKEYLVNRPAVLTSITGSTSKPKVVINHEALTTNRQNNPADTPKSLDLSNLFGVMVAPIGLI